ncbi:MAG: type II toxin-antitoxin system VapC family toxin [Candidatus Heimdallarchaeota archaeon]
MRIFVDTSAFYALEDESDKNNKSARAFEKDLITGKLGLAQILTSNFVFDELMTLVRRNLGHEKAVEVGERMRASKILTIERIRHKNEIRAWEIFKSYSDKEFSYTDCTSFALMESKAIRHTFAFDIHFEQMGFRRLP